MPSTSAEVVAQGLPWTTGGCEQRKQQKADNNQPQETTEQLHRAGGGKRSFRDDNPSVPLRNDFVHLAGRSNNQGGADKVKSSTGTTVHIDRLDQARHGDAKERWKDIQSVVAIVLDRI